MYVVHTGDAVTTSTAEHGLRRPTEELCAAAVQRMQVEAARSALTVSVSPGLKQTPTAGSTP
jgi:hypothetical protein